MIDVIDLFDDLVSAWGARGQRQITGNAGQRQGREQGAGAGAGQGPGKGSGHESLSSSVVMIGKAQDATLP